MRSFRISGLWAACHIRRDKCTSIHPSAKLSELKVIAIDSQGTIDKLHAQLDMATAAFASATKDLKESHRKNSALQEVLEFEQTRNAKLVEKLELAASERQEFLHEYTELDESLEASRRAINRLMEPLKFEQARNAELVEELELAASERQEFQLKNTELKEMIEVEQTRNAELVEELELAASERQEFQLENTELNQSLEASRCEIDRLKELLDVEQIRNDDLAEELELAANEREEFMLENTQLDESLEEGRREANQLMESLEKRYREVNMINVSLEESRCETSELKELLEESRREVNGFKRQLEVERTRNDELAEEVELAAGERREFFFENMKLEGSLEKSRSELDEVLTALRTVTAERDEAHKERWTANARIASLQDQLDAIEFPLAARSSDNNSGDNNSHGHGTSIFGHPSPALSADTPDASPSTCLDEHCSKLNDEGMHVEDYSHAQLENVRSACARMYAMFLTRFGKSPMTTELEHCIDGIEAFIKPAGQNDFEAARAVLSY